MIEIILLECKHFVVKLFVLVPPLQIFLKVDEILDIFVEDIGGCPPLLDDLIDHVGVEVDLRSCIFMEEFLLDGECPRLYVLDHLTYFYIISECPFIAN